MILAYWKTSNKAVSLSIARTVSTNLMVQAGSMEYLEDLPPRPLHNSSLEHGKGKNWRSLP